MTPRPKNRPIQETAEYKAMVMDLQKQSDHDLLIGIAAAQKIQGHIPGQCNAIADLWEAIAGVRKRVWALALSLLTIAGAVIAAVKIWK